MRRPPTYDFPKASIVTATERDFLHRHTPQAILEMIKDGTYDTKLAGFLNIMDPPEEARAVVVREIYAKRLSQSDVGKRKGLVITKKGVEDGYFPREVRDREGESMMLRFLNRRTREWVELRYCYYPSTQSYALTTGWCKFVKTNGVKEKDVVKFYECAKDDGERYVMIDVVRCGEKERVLRVLGEEGEVRKKRCKNGEEEEREGQNARKKVVRLFGVVIG